MDDIEKRTRRRHSAELKERVLAQCAHRGASVAKVALAHGLNANLVHRWRRGSAVDSTSGMESATGFVALPAAFDASPMPACEGIRIELRRGATTATVTWPIAAAAQCAQWLREWLK